MPRHKKPKPKAKKLLSMPELQFPPTSSVSGLTSVSLSVSSDKEAPAIVREILQNSLDAAQDANKECAHIVFSVETIKISDIPGLSDYKNALHKAAEFNERKNWPGQSKDIMESLQQSLNGNKLPVLFVSDNGIGLNKKRMASILSDGINDKGNDNVSTGLFGNGHFTTFNLSGLKYLLYGGVSKEDGMLASGHAILGSHQGKNEICGKDGYYVKKITKDIYNPFDFLTGEQIPHIIRDKMQKIESDWESGTVIGVLDFNSFGTDNKAVADLILGSAARNFFIAIHKGKLKVTYKSSGNEQSLNTDNLSSIIDSTKDSIRRTQNFPNYDKAKKFYELAVDGENGTNDAHQAEIKTEHGRFDIIYRQTEVSNTSIAFCRNGMWITDSTPLVMPRHFKDNVPFEAIIFCDEPSTAKLIRKAEGNLHNSLKLSDVKNKEQEKKLRKTLKTLQEHLQKLINKSPDSEEIDLLELPDGLGISTSPSTSRKSPSTGSVSRVNTGGTRKKGEKRTNNKKKKSDKGNMLPVRCVAVREDADHNTGKIKIRFVPLDDSTDVELRLIRHGGGDFSCDNPNIDNKRILLKAVKCEEKEYPIDENKESARIGPAVNEREKIIEIEFEKPGIQDCKISCEFVRRATTSS